jgi:hypothetical protein
LKCYNLQVSETRVRGISKKFENGEVLTDANKGGRKKKDNFNDFYYHLKKRNFPENMYMRSMRKISFSH